MTQSHHNRKLQPTQPSPTELKLFVMRNWSLSPEGIQDAGRDRFGPGNRDAIDKIVTDLMAVR